MSEPGAVVTDAVIEIQRRDIALYVTLNDPKTRNCLSPAMVDALAGVARDLPRDPSRCVILRGAGGSFCSGGDIGTFQAEAFSEPPTFGDDPVAARNRAFGQILEALDAVPQLLVSVVEGTAFGGGLGIACACDVVVARTDARLGLTETTLGVIPAQIAPFVVRRTGVPAARWLALVGARLGAEEAVRYRLVDIVCGSDEELEQTIRALVDGVRRCAPGANAETRRLMLAAACASRSSFLDDAARRFAATLRAEGREGAAAFTERRRPAWSEHS